MLRGHPSEGASQAAIQTTKRRALDACASQHPQHDIFAPKTKSKISSEINPISNLLFQIRF
jgi:hypothetical protein